MHTVEDITLFDTKECDILYDAIRAYICHLNLIKVSCRNPVLIDGIPIDQKIAMARKLRCVILPKTTKGKKHEDNVR